MYEGGLLGDPRENHLRIGLHTHSESANIKTDQNLIRFCCMTRACVFVYVGAIMFSPSACLVQHYSTAAPQQQH